MRRHISGGTNCRDAATTIELVSLPAILPLKDALQRDFYVQMASRERWSVRTLRDLLELGAGFSFVARQKRIQLDGDDFYLDLLFYNRKLRRPVALELKVGEFKAAYKGQMELYLRWLDKYEREPEEDPPLGIILCTGKKAEQIELLELLELDKSGIHVAERLTTIPSSCCVDRLNPHR